MARALGVAIVPYSPTAGGILTGKYRGGARPDGTRLATNQMYQTRYGDPGYWDVADRFTALAAELGHAPAALAVAWVAAHPAVTSVLLGARSVEQLDGTLAAADLELSAGGPRPHRRPHPRPPPRHRPQRREDRRPPLSPGFVRSGCRRRVRAPGEGGRREMSGGPSPLPLPAAAGRGRTAWRRRTVCARANGLRDGERSARRRTVCATAIGLRDGDRPARGRTVCARANGLREGDLCIAAM